MSRFERAGQVTSYLGLVPQEYSSGEKQRRGRVVRSAHPHLQSLLVQAAWRLWRVSDPRTAHFRTWAQAIARRRGKKVAMVVWSVAAVESRPTEGAAPPFGSSPAPVRDVPEKSANKRVSHLADGSEDNELDDHAFQRTRSRAHFRSWVRRLRALTGGVSENVSAPSTGRSDLTGRFIKAPTALIGIH